MRAVNIIETKPCKNAVALYGSAAILNRIASTIPWYRRNIERKLGQPIVFDGADFDALSFDKEIHRYYVHWIIPNGESKTIRIHLGGE